MKTFQITLIAFIMLITATGFAYAQTIHVVNYNPNAPGGLNVYETLH